MVVVAGRSTRSLASMPKRKQSKATVRKGAKVVASKRKLTHGNRLSKALAGASPTVIAQFKRTQRRIREIEIRALGKLRGGDPEPE